jgi:hypothetical protein
MRHRAWCESGQSRAKAIEATQSYFNQKKGRKKYMKKTKRKTGCKKIDKRYCSTCRYDRGDDCVEPAFVRNGGQRTTCFDQSKWRAKK